MDSLRSCAGCAAHILVAADTTSQMTFCAKCRSKRVRPHNDWVAALKAGDHVYVQPTIAWRGMSRSKYLIVARDGDQVTIQLIGSPQSRRTTTTAQLGQHDLTPIRPFG